MNVELNKNFPLEENIDNAWQLLSNIEAVAGCMPGAEISEVIDDSNFKGKVRVKLGPVNMAFSGTITVHSIDVEKKTIHLICEGTDNKGTTSASMDLTASVAEADETESALIGDAKVIVNGKLASFGQRMMAQVSDQILEQFADNFRKELMAQNSAKPAAATTVNSDELTAETTAASTATPTLLETGSNEINGFKFALNAIVGLIAGLFKRK